MSKQVACKDKGGEKQAQVAIARTRCATCLCNYHLCKHQLRGCCPPAKVQEGLNLVGASPWSSAHQHSLAAGHSALLQLSSAPWRLWLHSQLCLQL